VEDQVDSVLLADRLTRFQDAFFDGFPCEYIAIDTSTIIGNLDDEATRVVIGGETNVARFRLPVLFPLLSRFDAMVDGISDDMDQRVPKVLQHRFIQLGFLSAEREVHPFAQGLRGISNDPLHFLEGGFHRNHSKGH
jgi:hypothetical protein